MAQNADQAAYIANLTNIANSLQGVQTACQGYSNWLAHLPAGSLPAGTADVAAVNAAVTAQLAVIQKDLAVIQESLGLA